MNKILENVIVDDLHNVEIIDDRGMTLGQKVESFFGKLFFWQGKEVSEEEFCERCESGVFHWEIY